MDLSGLHELGGILLGIGSGIGLLWAFYRRVQEAIEKPLRDYIAVLLAERELMRIELKDCHDRRAAEHERMFKQVWDGMTERREPDSERRIRRWPEENEQ